MKVHVFTGVSTRVRNSTPDQTSPRRAGDIRPHRDQISGFAAAKWAARTTPTKVQNVTAGTGGAVPSAGMDKRAKTPAAGLDVGQRETTSCRGKGGNSNA